MTLNVQLDSEGIQSFVSKLNLRPRNHMQYRDGYKTAVNAFCVVKTNQGSLPHLSGHITGPNGNNAKFTVAVSEDRQIFIRVSPEAPEGYESEAALRDIRKALLVMMNRKGDARPNTKYWDGYYLKSAGKNKVGKRGISNLEEAAKSGLISNEFKTTCLSFGFTMCKFSPKEAA